MKTILITGHTGFIGTHLIQHLQKKFNIVGLSNNSQKNLKIKQIKNNICKINTSKIPENISSIIHLAAISDVHFCETNPYQTSLVNLQGTQNILELARKNDSKLVFISTSHVYGKSKKSPMKENYEKHPNSIYSGTKLAGEYLCESYSNTYGLNIGVARLFSVYGPHSPKHSLINSIITQILNSQSLKLGNLKTKRDFIFIQDVVSAIEKIMKNNHHFNDYNIGTGKKTSILELCTMINKIAGKNIPIKSIKSKIRKNDVSEIVADIKKIKKLGWIPKTTLHDGLKSTFEWYVNSKSN